MELFKSNLSKQHNILQYITIYYDMLDVTFRSLD